MRTEVFQFFVQGETGGLSGDFKKDAARFSEINGMKIGAIDYWRHVVAELDEMFAPLQLLGFVLCAKCNMMHRSRRDPAHLGVGHAEEINDPAGRRFVRRSEAETVS